MHKKAENKSVLPLYWRHNGHDSVSNYQPHDCLLNRLFRRRLKKISKLCVTGLCAGNSPETGEFPAQMASNAENVSMWWRHHASAAFLGYYWIVGVAIKSISDKGFANSRHHYHQIEFIGFIWIRHIANGKNHNNQTIAKMNIFRWWRDVIALQLSRYGIFRAKCE